MKGLLLRILSGDLAVCKLEPVSGMPDWVRTGEFRASIYSPGELTVICTQADVPANVQHEPGWRALGVCGKLDFSMVGVLVSLAQPLADAGVSIFALSTFETDYVLVKETALERAVQALITAGHLITN